MKSLGPLVRSEGPMGPPPPRLPRRSETVLDEDDWVDKVEAIIERDFFPELSKLEGKVQWLEAVRSGDPAQMRAAQLAFAERRAGLRPGTATGAGPLFTPGGTGARVLGGELPTLATPGLPTLATPGYEASGAGAARAVQAPAASLDAFLYSHTSEDNASFEGLLAAENGRRREAYAAIAAPPGSGGGDPAAPRPTDGFGTGGQPHDRLLSWQYRPRNALMYDGSQRDALALSDRERAAQVQGPPKAIRHRNTRFQGSGGPSFQSGDSTPASSVNGGGSTPARPGFRGVDGREYGVLSTPSFDPGQAPPALTWGDIEATPLRIEAEDLPRGDPGAGPAKFHIREASARERRGRDLAAGRGGAAGARGAGSGATPARASALATLSAQRAQATPGSARRAPTPMSSAAQRLASTLGPGAGKKGRAAGHMDAALRASYAGPRRGTAAGQRGGTGGGWGSACPTPAATPLRTVPRTAAGVPAPGGGAAAAAADATLFLDDLAKTQHVTDGLLHI